MAMLKDTVVSGSLRATDSLLATNLILSGTVTAGTAITIANGGTGVQSFTANSLIMSGNTATANLTTRAIGTGFSDNGNTLNIAYGGAGSSLAASAGTGTADTVSRSDHVHPFPALSSCTGTLKPNKGGTGCDSYAKGDILYASGAIGSNDTTVLTKLTIGTNGQILQVESGVPKWKSVATGVQLSNGSTTNKKYWLLGSSSTDGDGTTITNVYRERITGGQEDVGVYMNSNGFLYAIKVFNAVWNDIAEYRESIPQKPGTCVQENDNGCLTETNTRLIPGASIISDTFGFAEGKTDNATTPIAISGRVLAYTHQPRELYHAGMAVCSAPNGTVDIMTREEIQKYPDAIVGIVSEIPTYEQWGTGKVKIDGRIWIKVK